MAPPTGSDPSVPAPSGSPRALVVGFDPFAVPGLDAEGVDAALQRGQERFTERGITADLCLVPPDDTIEARIVDALQRTTYDCVVIGGGIRKPEPCLELFESVVNLVRRHSPDAEIAFNSGPEDSVDAVLRRLDRTP